MRNKDYKGQKRRGRNNSSDNRQSLRQVNAPFNFVPLSKQVVFAKDLFGNDAVSHDIPFSDGMTGVLNCKLSTQSPIYVRNGGNWTQEQLQNDPEAHSFFNVDGQYIIPGTSLKGMLRNVIEIISFGKMNIVDDYKYSIRDLYNQNLYGNKMSSGSKTSGFRSHPKSAWLTRGESSKEWYLTACDYARVELNNLIKYHEISGKGKPDLLRRQNAEDKYKKWKTALKISFNCPENDIAYEHSRNKKLFYKKATSLGSGSKKGTIVFTGQPNVAYQRNGNKHLDFIFFNEREKVKIKNEKLPEEFEFIHSSGGSPNDEWGFWKSKFLKGEKVPVFYLGQAENPTSMGLALMYRLAYNNSVCETIAHTSEDHLSSEPDLAETMFGHVTDKPLKGRVYISHAEADMKSAKAFGKPVQTILGGPKPSYYPIYIKQEFDENGKITTRDYKTFMDPDPKEGEKCEISGWKRYPARRSVTIPEYKPVPKEDDKEDNFSTKFTPLQEDAEFEFKIRFHNLRPLELGALIWALTWGGSEKLCHSLGMAKPLGLGRVKIDIDSSKIYHAKNPFEADEAQDLTKFAGIFSSIMERIVPDWAESDQLNQLLAMANPEIDPWKSTQKEKLRYMIMDPKRRENNEFVIAKEDKLCLLPHAEPKKEPKKQQNKQFRF